MEAKNMAAYLGNAGLISSEEVIITPLKGGVSSDIHLVQQGNRRFRGETGIGQTARQG